MADPGYIDLPPTAHFTFEYDKTLPNAAALAFGAAIAATADTDYNLLSSWFDGLIPPGAPFNVKINNLSSTRSGSNNAIKNITMDIGVGMADVPLGRMVLVGESAEMFMGAQNRGWFAGKSNGEALSQVAGFTIAPGTAGFSGPPAWLDSNNSARPNFVANTDPTDKNPVSYGCGILFLFYLTTQLGFSMRAIVQAAGDTLEKTYENLTQSSNAFPTFAALLAARFPPGVPSGLSGSSNPFPLPSSLSLSLKRYLAANSLQGQESIRDRVRSKNVGNLRAVLNSDQAAATLV